MYRASIQGKKMGRPAVKVQAFAVSTYLKPEEKEILEALAKAFDVSHGELLRRGFFAWAKSLEVPAEATPPAEVSMAAK